MAIKGKDMLVSVTIKLSETDLLFQQSTTCTTELVNAGKTTLEDVNPKTSAASPMIVVKDLATGDVSTHFVGRNPGDPPESEELPAGESIKATLFLSDFMQFPKPGEYEVSARFEFVGEGGAVESKHVKVKVSPSRPGRLNVSTANGGPGGLSLAAFLNKADPAKEEFDVWLATISTTEKPVVTNCRHIDEAKSLVVPFVSVPPNTAPYAQWVAWLGDGRLTYALHRGSDVAASESLKLKSSGYQIVPPIFQNPPIPGEAIPGGDVLLYRSAADADGGELVVAHLSTERKASLDAPVEVAAKNLAWAKTAYLSDAKRHTFVLADEDGAAVLGHFSWSPTSSPVFMKNEAAWPAKCSAADLITTKGDAVLGVMLGESGENEGRKYAFYKWNYTASAGFNDGSKIDIALPEGVGIDHAIVRVNAGGAPYGIVRTDGKEPAWYFCEPDGALKPIHGDSHEFNLPADILFRRGDDPVIMFSSDGDGFRLIKP